MFLTGIGWMSDMSLLFGTSLDRGKPVVFRERSPSLSEVDFYNYIRADLRGVAVIGLSLSLFPVRVHGHDDPIPHFHFQRFPGDC